jgi:hypothetical protein
MFDVGSEPFVQVEHGIDRWHVLKTLKVKLFRYVIIQVEILDW